MVPYTKSARYRWGQIAFTALLILTALWNLAPGASAASNPLDQRVGGTLAGFESKYGEPTNDPGTALDDIRTYKNKSYRDLSVQAIDGYIWHVSFESAPSTKWSPAKGALIARRFLPADAECDDIAAAKNNTITVTCTSVALTAIMFPADYQRVGRSGQPGSLTFTLTLDDDDDDRIAAVDAVIGTGKATVEQTDATSSGSSTNVTTTTSTGCGLVWISAVGGDVEMLSSSLEDLGYLLQDVTVYDLLDPVWVAQFHTALGTWQYVYSASISRDVPAGCADLNDEWIDVTWNLNEAASWYSTGLNHLDADAFEMGTYYLTAANDALDIFTPHFISAMDAAL